VFVVRPGKFNCSVSVITFLSGSADWSKLCSCLRVQKTCISQSVNQQVICRRCYITCPGVQTVLSVK